MTSSYDYDALWTKAKLFLNHAMDDGEERQFDERALWASLALELLGKAALARISPLLIAAPNEEGTNLLIASGLMAGEARFKAIPARTLYTRCSRAFKPFSFREAEQITFARNDYLHGGAAAFGGLPPEVWWPRYWGQAAILVNALDRQLVDLVGESRVEAVEAHLAQRERNIEERVEMLLERSRQRFEQYLAGTLPARLAEEWARAPDPSAGLTYSVAHDCPACGELGTLEGENVSDAELNHETVGDDIDAWMDLTIDAEFFSCENCRLVLDGYEYLVQAGLPTEFEGIGDVGDYFEPDYGND